MRSAAALWVLFGVVLALTSACSKANERGNGPVDLAPVVAEESPNDDSAPEVIQFTYTQEVLPGVGEVLHGVAWSENGDGQLLQSGQYEVGKRIGTWEYFDKEGTLETREEWVEDDLVAWTGKSQEDYSGFDFSSAWQKRELEWNGRHFKVQVVYKPSAKRHEGPPLKVWPDGDLDPLLLKILDACRAQIEGKSAGYVNELSESGKLHKATREVIDAHPVPQDCFRILKVVVRVPEPAK